MFQRTSHKAILFLPVLRSISRRMHANELIGLRGIQSVELEGVVDVVAIQQLPFAEPHALECTVPPNCDRRVVSARHFCLLKFHTCFKLLGFLTNADLAWFEKQEERRSPCLGVSSRKRYEGFYFFIRRLRFACCAVAVEPKATVMLNALTKTALGT